MRTAANIGRLTDRLVQARYGVSGASIVSAGRASDVRDPCARTSIDFLKRFDLACMMYSRTMKISDNIHFELLLDSSPSLYEVLCVLEITMQFDNPSAECKPSVFRRECPPMILEHKQMGAVGKIMALLKSWFLVRGPSEARLYPFAQKVVNFPTDFGAESQIALA